MTKIHTKDKNDLKIRMKMDIIYKIIIYTFTTKSPTAIMVRMQRSKTFKMLRKSNYQPKILQLAKLVKNEQEIKKKKDGKIKTFPSTF